MFNFLFQEIWSVYKLQAKRENWWDQNSGFPKRETRPHFDTGKCLKAWRSSDGTWIGMKQDIVNIYQYILFNLCKKTLCPLGIKHLKVFKVAVIVL